MANLLASQLPAKSSQRAPPPQSKRNGTQSHSLRAKLSLIICEKIQKRAKTKPHCPLKTPRRKLAEALNNSALLTRWPTLPTHLSSHGPRLPNGTAISSPSGPAPSARSASAKNSRRHFTF